jgi:hypothetical protein
VPRVLSLGYRGQGMKLITGDLLMPRLRMSGAIPPLLVNAFMAWTGATFTVTF